VSSLVHGARLIVLGCREGAAREVDCSPSRKESRGLGPLGRPDGWVHVIPPGTGGRDASAAVLSANRSGIDGRAVDAYSSPEDLIKAWSTADLTRSLYG
jgi:hypothetical protein